jgi:hypothetical protein
MELEHRSAHQRVRGQRICPIHTLVDHEHACAGPSQQHRCGGTGATGADNDDVNVSGHEPSRDASLKPGSRDVFGQEPRIVSDSVDETGIATPLEVEPQHVQAAVRGDTALMVDLAATVQHWDTQPGIGTAVSGRPDDGADPLGLQIELQRRVIRERPGRDERLRLASGRCRPLN